MTVTPLHQRPVWVPVPELGAARLDPLYYDPTLTIAEHHLRSNGKLSWRRLKQVADEVYSFGAYELTNHIQFVEPQNGSIPFVTVTEIDNPFVDMTRVRHIDRASHELLTKSRCTAGTLLLSMAGSIGRTGVIPSGVGECNSNQDVAKVRVNTGESDPQFLASYFSSRIGVAACEREAAGAVQKHLYLYNIEQLPVPCPSKQLRTAIGHKVRAAERLRAASATAQSTINTWLADCLPKWDEPGGQLSVTPAFSCDIDTERLDPWYNHRQFQQLEATLAATPLLISLFSVGALVTDRWNGTSGEIEYVEIGEFDLAQGTAHGKVIAAANAPSRAQIAARSGDLAVSLVRPNRKNIVFIQGSGRRQIVVTSGCEVLRFANEDIAALYSVVLRHNAVTHQIMRWNTGTSYPAIEKLRTDRVLVPAIPDDKKDELLKAARLAVTGVERAKALTQEAIADVESLIDGKLDEEKCLKQGRELAEEFGLEVP